MPRVTNNLRNAQTLAEFSNLEPNRLDYFRNNYPNFVPQAWWDYKNGLQWRKTQEFLRRWWENCSTRAGARRTAPDWNSNSLASSPVSELIRGAHLIQDKAALPSTSVSEVMRLILSVFDPRHPPTLTSIDEMSWESVPFQKAVLYLFEQPWRARFCAQCNKRFVAAEPKNKFCSDACSNESRLHQKRNAWHAHKNQWRPQKNRRKHTAARRYKRKRNR